MDEADGLILVRDTCHAARGNRLGDEGSLLVGNALGLSRLQVNQRGSIGTSRETWISDRALEFSAAEAVDDATGDAEEEDEDRECESFVVDASEFFSFWIWCNAKTLAQKQ